MSELLLIIGTAAEPTAAIELLSRRRTRQSLTELGAALWL